MNNKLKILIIIGIAVLVIIVFIAVSLIGGLGRGPQPPEKTSFPTPTAAFIEGELYIAKIMPVDTTKIYTPAQPIEVSFTQGVDKLGLKYETHPATETFVVDSPIPNSLIIVPTTVWKIGVTSITILDNTTSAEGRKLKNPQTYILNTAVPTVPPNLEGNY